MEAVKSGVFHVYAVKTVDEGLEILTGVPAGERSPDGTYPEGTLNHLADATLRGFAGSLRGFYAEMVEGVAS